MAGTLTIDTLRAGSGVLATQNGMTGIPKAWVNFSGTTANSAYNISSITNPATGTFTITFTTSMPNVNYCIQITSSFASGIREDIFGLVYNDAPYTPTTTAFTVKFYRADTNVAVNPTFGYVAVLSS
jgi:hypothetical protein